MVKLTFLSHYHSCIMRMLFLKTENRQKPFEKHNVTGSYTDVY